MQRTLRSHSLWSVLLAVAVLGAACSSGDGSDVAAGGDAADTAWCDAWIAMAIENDDDGAEESPEDLEAEAARVRDLAEVLVDEAPDAHRAEMESAQAAMLQADELLSKYGYDFDRFQAEGSPDDFAALTALADDPTMLSLGTGAAAQYAFDSCEGAPDPAFEFDCAVEGFRAVPRPPSMETIPVDQLSDPDVVADETLARTDDAVEWKRRDTAGGNPEYAFLDADGRTVAVVELEADGGEWLDVTRNCVGEPLF